jgi:diaminohydroxyphosphoribosylaminopyrimidine deaminase/5-amino-6-(5-phosphoribosylamino)uracil reductase
VTTQDDSRFMVRALKLAEKGMGRTHPNPMVGAVVVKEGHIVGEGWHKGPGELHAEALALRNAGPEAEGGTLYVNLEPCDHHGRTPPCTENIIKARISRVIAACGDPHPLVNGKGFNRLMENGIDVISGVMRERAEELNRAFLHAAVRNGPYVTLKMASTLDGRIADSLGQSKWITGTDARLVVHKLRAQVDAILVGIGTVLADDPRLDVRDVRGSRNPFRVILDPSFQIPIDSQLVRNAADGKTLIVVDKDVDSGYREPFERMGVCFLALPAVSGMFRWHDLAGSMIDRDILHILVEGGARTATWFLAQSAVRRLELFVAPEFMGERGLSSVLDLSIKSLDDAVKFEFRQCRRIGKDVHIIADAR